MKPEKNTHEVDLSGIKQEMKVLIEQKLGMAEMQTAIIDAIRKDPDLSRDELWGIAYPFLDSYNMPAEDRDKTIEIIDKYIDKHKAINKARETYPVDIKFFKYLFGEKPHGKIEIITGPASIYVRCYNLQDFTLINSGAFMDSNQRGVTEEETKEAIKRGGVSLSQAKQEEFAGTIIAENTSIIKTADRQSIFEHEEQHAIKKLFEEPLRNSYFSGQEDVSDKKIAETMVETYIRIWRRNTLELQAKDEILAYMKTGADGRGVHNIITLPKKEGGLYEYATDQIATIKNDAKQWKPIFREALTDKLIQNIFEDEYWKVVGSGCRAFDKLRDKLKLTTQDVVNLLTVEPLSKWEKLAERLLKYAKE